MTKTWFLGILALFAVAGFCLEGRGEFPKSAVLLDEIGKAAPSLSPRQTSPFVALYVILGDRALFCNGFQLFQNGQSGGAVSTARIWNRSTPAASDSRPCTPMARPSPPFSRSRPTCFVNRPFSPII